MYTPHLSNAPVAHGLIGTKRFSHSDVFVDVGVSEQVVGGIFYPHSISVTDEAKQFRGSMKAVEVGPFAMAELDYNIGLRMDVPEVDSYHLNMALEGGLRSRSLGKEVHSMPGRAAVYRPGSDAVLLTRPDSTFTIFALKVSARALENTLAGLLGHLPDREPLLLDAELDVTAGEGSKWWKLLTVIRAQWASERLSTNPLVTEPLAQSILAGFLLATGHQHSEALQVEPSRTVVPATVRLAEDYILERLAEPVTVVDVARRVGVSTRALQRSFVEYLGETPTQYIRTKRLSRVHADLLAADPMQTRVADVAARWGFTHLGRFANDYRAMYGISPSRALRS